MNRVIRQPLTSDPFEGCCWIWPHRFAELHNSYAQFRHDFKLEKVPQKAYLSITADQCYKLYVNGQYVARGPARGFQHRWPYDKIDLASFLKVGHNWLSVEAYNPGISTFSYIHHAAAGLIVSAKWGKTKIQTGPNWLCHRDIAHTQDTHRLSVQLGFQEHLDLQIEDRRWITSAKQPTKWHTSIETRTVGAMPWHAFEPRNLPMLTRDILEYKSLNLNLVADVSDKLLAENNRSDKSNPTNLYTSLEWHRKDAAPAVTNSQKTEQGWVTLSSKSPNQATATVLDLGKPGVGFVQLQIKNAQAGQRLDILFSEVLDEQGLPIFHPQKSNHSLVAMASRLTLKKGNIDASLFTLIGHRYIVLVSYGPSAVRVKPTLCQNIYPLDIRGSFACDNPEVNDIYRISVQTQRVCALDAYVDTPWREQAQWWGDARVQSQNTFHLCNDTRLFERGIDQIATQEVPNGLTYGHAPTIAHGCILPDFSLIWLITLWDLYQQTGDPDVIKKYWPRVERVLNYFQTEGLHASGLLQYDPRYWLFMDWCDLPKDGCPTLLNLWYIYALDKLIELTKQAKMTSQNRQLVKCRNQTYKAINALLWDDKKSLFIDGRDLKGKPIRSHAIHNQTIAILTGLHPKAHQTMMQQVLLPYLNNQKIKSPLPSSYWVTYVYEAATLLGHGKQVVDHLHGHWSPMIRYGGTREIFSQSSLGLASCSHAWSAHPIYHLTRTLGGIVQTSPSWKTIRFAPITNSPLVADNVKVTVPTPHGLIHAQWHRQGKKVQAKLTLPSSIEADVELPGILDKKVTGKNTWHWCE